MMTAWSILTVGAGILGGVVYLVWRSDREYVREQAEAPTQLLWAHHVPGGAVTVAHAHTIMQQHRACNREHCPRKAIAWDVLVDAGRITPDSGRTY